MPHKSPIFVTFFLAVFFLLPPVSLAETEAVGGKLRGKQEEKQVQKKLRSVIQQLEQTAQQRKQQSTRIDELSQRLECNWTLIRAYEICGQLHQNDPDGHLQCSAHAKQNAARCLGNKEEEK